MDWAGWPLWATILKRVITLLIMAAFGLHAYVQYRRHGEKIPTAERWVFFTFSMVFLFGIAVNSVAIILAAELNMRQGPFGFGVFSLLMGVVYLIFAYRDVRRISDGVWGKLQR